METSEAVEFARNAIREALDSIREKGIVIADINTRGRVTCEDQVTALGFEWEIYFDGALFKVRV